MYTYTPFRKMFCTTHVQKNITTKLNIQSYNYICVFYGSYTLATYDINVRVCVYTSSNM